MLVTDCESKQMKHVLVRWFRHLFGKTSWNEIFPNHDEGCVTTQNKGRDKYHLYEKWLKRVTAFFVSSDATYEQAESYFIKKLPSEWWYGCRSELVAILSVSHNAAKWVAANKELVAKEEKTYFDCPHCGGCHGYKIPADTDEGEITVKCKQENGQLFKVQYENANDLGLTPNKADMPTIIKIKNSNRASQIKTALEHLGLGLGLALTPAA
jgi:hypothetical protein